MAWTFVEVVDTGQDANVAGRSVYWLRATFTDGAETRCITAYFYDSPPTTQQRIARRDAILAQLNEPPPLREFLEEYGDEIRARIDRAIANGRTRQQIANAILTRLEELLT